jgi:DNA-binding transcriptional ArsR family regulator
MSQPTTLPVAPDSVKLLEPSAVLRAVSDAMRHALLRVLLDGRPQSVNELAARFNRPPDGISKHLRVLRDARLIRAVAPPPGSDGRKQYHELPPLFRSRDSAGKTILDFGTVLLRLD